MTRPSSHNCPECRAGYLEWDFIAREWVCQDCDWTSRYENEKDAVWHQH